MNRLLQNRLILQLLFTFVAAISVATLSVVLITEAIGGAERVVLGEANRTVATALKELQQQYHYRESSDSSWSSLPAKARDVSLRGITQTVLRSYPGVEGGFYADADFLGYSFPTHDIGSAKTDVPTAERDLIVSLARQSERTSRTANQVVHGKTDLLVLAAAPTQDRGTAVWTMKRLVGRAAPTSGRREILLSILVIAALVSIAGTLATGLSLARGVAQIQTGLSALEQNFEYRLPERADELGGISRSINRMSKVRGKLEGELRREDRLRAVGRLAAGFAHEIRNPLNSIRLTVQLLERRLEMNSIRSEDLRTVRNEVDRLSTLLNDLLDLQRSRPARPETQAIAPVLQRCIGLLERQAEMQNTQVCFEPPPREIHALFDSQQLTQVVVNLLLNAIEVSPPGGKIFLRIFEDKGAAKVEVRDEGPGMSYEQQEQLFEPFYTTKPGGTGLGLAVSRELMRSQAGDLVFSPSPTGACFTVELSSK